MQCLRSLPLDATLLIGEMRAHWKDLSELKAAGGTPSARCVKGFEITNDGWGITIEAKSAELRIRRAFFGAKNPCQRCVAIIEADADEGGHCSLCQIRWTRVEGSSNTRFFSRLERRGFSWR